MKELHAGYSINLRQLAIRDQITFDLLQKVGNLLPFVLCLIKQACTKLSAPCKFSCEICELRATPTMF
jgi:hypothetical protein